VGKNDQQTESTGTRRKRCEITTGRKEQGPSALPGVRLLLLLEIKVCRAGASAGREERGGEGGGTTEGGVEARVSSYWSCLRMG
jgi:hypothetical protein